MMYYCNFVTYIVIHFEILYILHLGLKYLYLSVDGLLYDLKRNLITIKLLICIYFK